jgi:hypothetical protein
MAPVHEVAFELECFEWAEERLEVAGRWKGLGAHRLNRPVLTIDTDTGRRKRIVAMPGGHVGVAGETWRATFAWPGDPAEITGAELEVGGSLVVDLPLPDRRRRRRRRSAVDQQNDEALRAEVDALRGQVDRLRAELAGREREIIALHAQLDQQAGEEDEPARAGADDRTVELKKLAGADEMTVEIQRLVGEVERLHDEKQTAAEEMTVEIRRLAGEVERLQEEKAAGAGAMMTELERLAAERDAARAETEAAVAAERERWQTEIDELRQAFADAAAEAEEARDRHRAALAALEDQLREERAHVARLSTQLPARPAQAADREQATGPPTEAMPPPGEPIAGEPTEAMPPSAGEPTAAMPPPGEPAEAISPGESTQPMPPPDESTGDAPGEATIEAAVLDAPGPLRAGSRPASPPGTEEETEASFGLEDPEREGAGSALQSLKARFEGLFASNGDAQHEDPDEEFAVPRPRRTAAAARARAGATVAARRSPGEVWATRVLAAVVVAVLLTAFVLILAYIA